LRNPRGSLSILEIGPISPDDRDRECSFSLTSTYVVVSVYVRS
jgi:hypothetical protein